jgi:hypothetical protein
VPPGILNGLEQRVLQTTARNLACTRQLAGLLQRLGARGIRALTFKGPTLAAGSYGHLGLRSSSDLDLLVDRRSASRVRQLMLVDGYTLPPRRRQFVGSLLFGLYAGAGRDDTLRAPNPGLADVDIHVAFAFWTQGIRLDTDAMFERAVTTDVAGESLPTLCPEDLLLVLAIHGMMHGWSRLRLVSDIDAVASRVADWDAVIERARAARMGRTLRVALLIAQEILGTRLPADVFRMAALDDQARAIARTAGARLPVAIFSGDDWDPRPWFVSFLEKPGDRVRFHARRLIYEWFLKWPWDEWLGRRRLGSRHV